MLSLDLLTYEPSNHIHTFLKAELTQDVSGIFSVSVETEAMNIIMWQNSFDVIRLFLIPIWVLWTLGYFILFVRKLIRKKREYNRWYNLEIEGLTDFEKQKRREYRPEFVRQIVAIANIFVLIDICVFILAIAMVVEWIIL